MPRIMDLHVPRERICQRSHTEPESEHYMDSGVPRQDMSEKPYRARVWALHTSLQGVLVTFEDTSIASYIHTYIYIVSNTQQGFSRSELATLLMLITAFFRTVFHPKLPVDSLTCMVYEVSRQHGVALLRACVEKRGGTTRVLNQRAGDRRGKRESDARLRMSKKHRDTALRHRRREWTQRRRDTNVCILINDK